MWLHVCPWCIADYILRCLMLFLRWSSWQVLLDRLLFPYRQDREKEDFPSMWMVTLWTSNDVRGYIVVCLPVMFWLCHCFNFSFCLPQNLISVLVIYLFLLRWLCCWLSDLHSLWDYLKCIGGSELIWLTDNSL